MTAVLPAPVTVFVMVALVPTKVTAIAAFASAVTVVTTLDSAFKAPTSRRFNTESATVGAVAASGLTVSTVIVGVRRAEPALSAASDQPFTVRLIVPVATPSGGVKLAS